MKKGVISLVCILGVSVASLAAGKVIEFQKAGSDAAAFASVELCNEKVNENFTQISHIDPIENFVCIMNCCDEAKYGNISAYVRFMCENNFSAGQLSEINNILKSGTTVQSLAQVYDFWLTTDEDFSVISEICSLENKYFGEFWFEDAFNYITDNEHGVLTRSDVRDYMSKGLSADQILAANTLSRKEGQNVSDILNSL